MRLGILVGLLALFCVTTCCAPTQKLTVTKPEQDRVDAVPLVIPEVQEVQGAAHVVPKLKFEGEVTDTTVNATIALMDQVEPKSDALVLEINSIGGNVDAGFRLVKRIESFKKPVICIVDGEADSEAFYILQGCDGRLMTSRSTLMAHEPFIQVSGATNVTRTWLKEMTAHQAAVAEAWTEFAGRRMKITVAEFRERVNGKDWEMAAQEAVEVGAVDGITPSVKAAWDGMQKDLTAPVLKR